MNKDEKSEDSTLLELEACVEDGEKVAGAAVSPRSAEFEALLAGGTGTACPACCACAVLPAQDNPSNVPITAPATAKPKCLVISLTFRDPLRLNAVASDLFANR
jgi:hypothetical protein